MIFSRPNQVIFSTTAPGSSSLAGLGTLLHRNWDVTRERDGKIVAVVHPALYMGEAYVEVSAEDAGLKRDMLAYAEEHLAACSGGAKALRMHISGQDDEFQHIALQRGYETGDSYEEMSHFVIPNPFPAISLPDGF